MAAVPALPALQCTGHDSDSWPESILHEVEEEAWAIIHTGQGIALHQRSCRKRWLYHGVAEASSACPPVVQTSMEHWTDEAYHSKATLPDVEYDQRQEAEVEPGTGGHGVTMLGQACDFRITAENSRDPSSAVDIAVTGDTETRATSEATVT